MLGLRKERPHMQAGKAISALPSNELLTRLSRFPLELVLLYELFGT